MALPSSQRSSRFEGAQARPGGGIASGSYTGVEGPLAGQGVYVSPSGSASILGAAGKLQVPPAADGCDAPHLTGVVDGR